MERGEDPGELDPLVEEEKEGESMNMATPTRSREKEPPRERAGLVEQRETVYSLLHVFLGNVPRKRRELEINKLVSWLGEKRSEKW